GHDNLEDRDPQHDFCTLGSNRIHQLRPVAPAKPPHLHFGDLRLRAAFAYGAARSTIILLVDHCNTLLLNSPVVAI
ncbi:MAG: hypothetical protein ACREDR_21455, partial [Blastocatellia bacterium]